MGIDSWCIRHEVGVLRTILLYRLGWDRCILVAIGRWLLCSGGCLLRFHCIEYSCLPITKYMNPCMVVWCRVHNYTDL